MQGGIRRGSFELRAPQQLCRIHFRACSSLYIARSFFPSQTSHGPSVLVCVQRLSHLPELDPSASDTWHLLALVMMCLWWHGLRNGYFIDYCLLNMMTLASQVTVTDLHKYYRQLWMKNMWQMAAANSPMRWNRVGTDILTSIENAGSRCIFGAHHQSINFLFLNFGSFLILFFLTIHSIRKGSFFSPCNQWKSCKTNNKSMLSQPPKTSGR